MQLFTTTPNEHGYEGKVTDHNQYGIHERIADTQTNGKAGIRQDGKELDYKKQGDEVSGITGNETGHGFDQLTGMT